jgi:hypothetical protein
MSARSALARRSSAISPPPPFFTNHSRAPFGDLVGYVATNLTHAIDDRGPATTRLTFTPSFRMHLGHNWYLVGGVDVPATNPKSFDYSIPSGLMYVC